MPHSNNRLFARLGVGYIDPLKSYLTVTKLHQGEVLGAVPDLRALLVKYEQFFLAQVQQTAACNAVHDIHARMCRWLLRMHDLVGTDLPLTQEFLAQMMGVRRTSVTEVAGELQRAGLV